jgi:hypothetical protein
MRNFLTTRILAALPDGRTFTCAAAGLAWGLLSLAFQAPVVEAGRYWFRHLRARWRRARHRNHSAGPASRCFS